MPPADRAGADGACSQVFVEPRQAVLGGGHRSCQGSPRGSNWELRMSLKRRYMIFISEAKLNLASVTETVRFAVLD